MYDERSSNSADGYARSVQPIERYLELVAPAVRTYNESFVRCNAELLEIRPTATKIIRMVVVVIIGGKNVLCLLSEQRQEKSFVQNRDH